MARNRITKPQNLGQNRNVQMRNNARKGGANMPFQGGLADRPAQQCPAGQEPKMVNGRMQCVPAEAAKPDAPKPKRNSGSY